MEETASSDREALTFNLDSFLSAARSVRYLLKKEFEGADGFADWWKEKEPDWPSPANDLEEIEDSVRAANAFFWNARNITIHEGIIQPTADFGTASGVMVNFKRTDEGQLIFPLTPVFCDLGDEVQSDSGATLENPKYYFVDFRDKDVLTLCTEYLGRLEELVAKAQMKFG